MTYEQIQQIDFYLTDIQELQYSAEPAVVRCPKAKSLDSQINSSVNGYRPKGISWGFLELAIGQHDPSAENVLQGYIQIMFASLRSVWNAIPNREKILEVGGDVAYGRTLSVALVSYKQEYIIKIIGKYSSEIGFNDDALKMAKVIPSKIEVDEQKTHSIYRNVLSELEKYLNSLCENKTYGEGSGMAMGNIQINNNLIGGNATANASASAQVTVDISVQIEQTVEQVKDACLKPEEEAAILAKLDELKEISQEKSKKTKWDKIKGIFKWLAEQGLQVAGWLVPLIYQIMQGV